MGRLNLGHFACCTRGCVGGARCEFGVRCLTWTTCHLACLLVFVYALHNRRKLDKSQGGLRRLLSNERYLEQTSLPNTLLWKDLVLYRKYSENGSFIR